jgi:putative transposase
MARSVYYYHAQQSLQADLHHAAKTKIQAIYHHHQGRYGYRRVHLELRNQHHYLDPKTVQKLMGQLGLKSTVRPKRYQSYQGDFGKAAPNLLERKFGAKQTQSKVGH